MDMDKSTLHAGPAMDSSKWFEWLIHWKRLKIKMGFIKYIISLLVCLACMIPAISGFGQTKALKAVSDLDQVFEDGYRLPQTEDTMHIFGIRGEILSGQAVLMTKKNLSEVRVTTGPLVNRTSGYLIPDTNVAWNFVGSIPLSENAPNQLEEVLVRKAPARFPDYLMDVVEMDLRKGANQAIWITIEIPNDAEAGEYAGSISVNSSAGEVSLPLHLTVYPLNMPEKRHLKVTEWFSTGQFGKFHGIDEQYSEKWFEMLRIYADNLVQHRQNIFQVPMSAIEIAMDEEGQLEFDFTRFDQIAQVFWETGKMDFLETGELARFGEKVWFDTKIEFKNFTVFSKEKQEQMNLEGMQVIPYLLPAFENHLRSRGWLTTPRSRRS